MRILFLIMLTCLIACNPSIKYPDGGYDYPQNLSNNDTSFYMYPLIKSLSIRDSVYAATEYLLYQPFNEPNLSIKPQSNDVFRLTYSSWQEPSYIIVLREKSIVIKKGFADEMYDNDTTRLTQQGNADLLFIDNNFWNYTAEKSKWKHYYDSLRGSSPKLFDSKYYVYLKKKRMAPPLKPFVYTTTIINIKKNQFLEIVDAVNKSGYWKLPHVVTCETYSTDGGGFVLEANTSKKYNRVSMNVCPDSNNAFVNACQKLINTANLQKEIMLSYKNKATTDNVQ